MQEESTTHLNDILNKEVNKNNLDAFISQHERTFPIKGLFSEYIAKNPITSADIVKNCKGYISKSYIHEIIGDKKNNPSRDITLILCIAAHMDRKTTRKVLENYGHRDLYVKDTRDIIIATYINNKDFDLCSIDEELDRHQLPTLNPDRVTD